MSLSLFELKNVGFQVNQTKILENLSFIVKEGEFITISGPSGSGKSTLLKILATMLSPTEGTILFEQKKLQEYEPTAYRKTVSYTFQTPTLFGETVLDNLCFPFEIRDQKFDEERAIHLLKTVGLPKEYLKKDITSLSGGERQRIALIRNLLFPTKVLLLDEVTSALDEENRKIIRNFVKKINKEEHITVLWVTHNMEEINEASRHIELIAGTIKEDTHG